MFRTATLAATLLSVVAVSASAVQFSWLLFAAGVELAFGESFYRKLEYRYSNYQPGISRNQIVAGVGMRFQA